VRRGEVAAAFGVKEVLDALVVEEERVAAGPGAERDLAGRDDVRLGAERDLGVGDDLRARDLVRPGLGAPGQVHAHGLPAVGDRAERVDERDVGQVIAVVVDVQPVDGIRVESADLGIRVEDEHGPAGRVRGRLEGVQIAEVQALVPEGRAQAEAGEVVGHE
jgi:hypothetical protein